MIFLIIICNEKIEEGWKMVANVGLHTQSAIGGLVSQTATSGIKKAGDTAELVLANKNELAKTGTTALTVIKDAAAKNLSKGKIAALIGGGIAAVALVAAALNNNKNADNEAAAQEQTLYA